MQKITTILVGLSLLLVAMEPTMAQNNDKNAKPVVVENGSDNPVPVEIVSPAPKATMPAKIDLGGNLSDGQILLTDTAYQVPADHRFHLREIACNRGTVTAALQARQFSLTINGRRFSSRFGVNLRQQVVQTPIGGDAVTLFDLTQTVWQRNTFFESGERIELFLRREAPPFTGFMDNFVCTLSGFMEPL